MHHPKATLQSCTASICAEHTLRRFSRTAMRAQGTDLLGLAGIQLCRCCNSTDGDTAPAATRAPRCTHRQGSASEDCLP